MNPEVWRREYEQNRYLEHVPGDELEKRLEDLANNLWSTDLDGNVIPTRFPEHREQLLRLHKHASLEKFAREGGGVNLDEATLIRQTSSDYEKPQLNKPINFSLDVLVKFGATEHIEAAYEEGRLRIALAGTYNDPSLNPAINDNELVQRTSTTQKHLKFNLRGADGKIVPHKPAELHQGRSIPNYYVWCCALGYDARLFNDFEYNAALVIKDPSEFINRLESAVADKLGNVSPHHKAVSYYDPKLTPFEMIEPRFSKNFRYLYQNEYRFCWDALDPRSLDHFYVEIGSLKDIACVLKTV